MTASSLPGPGSPRGPVGWRYGNGVPKGAGETESQWRERERELKPYLLKMANYGRRDRHGNTHKSNKGTITKGHPPCDIPQHVGDRVRCS